MEVKFNKLDAVNGEIVINLVKSDYEADLQKALKDYARKAQMPGFRPGKVPMPIIVKRVGSQLKAEAVERKFSEELQRYITAEKLNMLGQPLQSERQQTIDIESQDDFEFIVDIALAPEMKVSLTKRDKVAYYDIVVDDEKIDQQIEGMRRQAGHAESVEEYALGDVMRGELVELENGEPKEGGIVVEKTSILPQYFNDDAQKTLFDGAKKDSTVTFNPSVAYSGNDTEISSLLRIKKEEVGEHKGDFAFRIAEISRMVPAEVNQEFFDRIYGEGNIKSEEELRTRIKTEMQDQFVADSDYKFLLDVRTHVMGKLGKLEFPEKLLKRLMQANNPDKGPEFVEENFEKSIEELQWHLAKEQLLQQNEVKIENDELRQTAIQAARFQFAQYGMNNIPDDYLSQYAESMLKDERQRGALVERAIDTKLATVLKNVVTLQHKEVSLEEFNKLFETK